MVFSFSLLTGLLSLLVGLYPGVTSLEKKRYPAVRTIGFLFFVIAVMSAVTRNLTVIQSGHVGISELHGKVSPQPLKPGLHWSHPFADIEVFSTRLKEVKEDIEATSKEGLKFNVHVSIQYRLDPQKVIDVYENIGTDETGILIAQFRSLVREVTARYPVEAVVSEKRQELTHILRDRMQEKLAGLGYRVEDVLLREVLLPEEIQSAFEEKLKADQESQAMSFVLEKERQEAERLKIQTEAGAERQRIEAEATAAAQTLIAENLDPLLVQLRAIEAAERIAQNIAESPNAKIVYSSGQAGDFHLPFWGNVENFNPPSNHN